MPPKLRPGVGAIASCISRFIHPSKPIREKNPNRQKGHKLEGCIIIDQVEKTIKRGSEKPIPCYTFSHPDYDGIIFYASRHYVHVTTEGPVDSLFAAVDSRSSVGGETVVEAEVISNQVEGNEDISTLITRSDQTLTSDDIAGYRRQGISVDDDNEPAPKNLPSVVLPDEAVTPPVLEWKKDGIICPRLANNLRNSAAGLKNYSFDEVKKMTKLELFLTLFPVNFLNEVLIPETNKNLALPIDLREFIVWVGCWFYMALWVGIEHRHDWWSSSAPSMFGVAQFCLNDYMSRDRFDSILVAIQ